HVEGEALPADQAGQNRLAEWLTGQPDNYFSADKDLQRKLELYLGKAAYVALLPQMYKYGSTLAKEVDPLVRSSNLTENLPRLAATDEIGRAVQDVIYHPDYHAAGRLIYAGGPMSAHAEPGNNKLALAKFYMSAQNGEAGHNCPLACTAGVIKVLQHIAPDSLREKYLPKLLDENYDTNFTGAQFMTEIQGGSDVGANTVAATPEDNDSDVWFLNGDKWFCSNVTADLALVTARTGADEGTKGLGLFLVPRQLDSGALNGMHIHKLKDKLGTRSLATAEVTFKDAQGWRVGEFKDAMTYVVNTSRIYNAFGCAGNARRALVVAWSYANSRLAFGQPIIRFPLVQDQITKMKADWAAILAGSMRIAKVWDDVETGKGSDDDVMFLRMAVALNKYRSSILAHEVIQQGIEILGGNGTIESFSVLPRLLRDNVVYENWEGTHNVLLAQVQRDIRKSAIHKPFFEHIRTQFTNTFMAELKTEGLHQLEKLEGEMEEVLKMDELTGAIFFRPLMDRVTDLYYTASMAAESGWERKAKEDKTKARLAIFFLNRRVSGLRPGDITYYDDQVARLSSQI
ncbi:MAG: acyl-CoA dehydrogenase, partial [Candidatus Promineifilaceae bacterium]